MNRDNEWQVEEASVLGFASSVASRIFQNTSALKGKAVYFSGQMPFVYSDLESLLPNQIFRADLAIAPPAAYAEPTTAFVVLGNEGFEEDEIERFVEETQRNAAFLPQEGFLDFVLFGYDWWHEYIDVLDQSLEHHKGLQFVKSLESSRWPSTVSQETEGTQVGELEFNNESPLHQAGYMIRGRRNRRTTRKERWAILSKLVDNHDLSLQEIANTISGLAVGRKRQFDGTDTYWYAIQEWEHDLERLKRVYFDARLYDFNWPSTGISG